MSTSYEKLFQRTTQGIKPGLDVISALLETLGNPHHRLAVIHVAGTNGKGSVCAMLESMLRASGFKTGLYTSPHLMDFSERFRVNGERIPEARLDRYIVQIEEAADRTAAATGLRDATFFEISTAIAFEYFADEQVEIAIIETGMGGRWDATNVVIPLVSIITHIDIDHTGFLGDSIEQIAAEKAGIIKPGRPVVTAPQSPAVMAVLEQSNEPLICSSEAVSITQLGKPQKIRIETQCRTLPPVRLPLLGKCQRENCAVAVAAMERIADLFDFEPAFSQGLESVIWAARFEELKSRPLIILDGAHNPSAARSLVETLEELYPGHSMGFILGFLDDKDVSGFLRTIKPLAAAVWTVRVDAARGASAETTASQARACGVDAIPCSLEEAWCSASSWATTDPDRLVCITGSLCLKDALTAAGCL